jgi:hypothetical protein
MFRIPLLIDFCPKFAGLLDQIIGVRNPSRHGIAGKKIINAVVVHTL